MKHINSVSTFLSLLFVTVFGVASSYAQCPPAPAGCVGCGINNPTFATVLGNETCVGLADGSLQFLNLAFTDGMTYPITFEWYLGADCSGAIVSTGTVTG